jgi:hypothetical protein
MVGIAGCGFVTLDFDDPPDIVISNRIHQPTGPMLGQPSRDLLVTV